MSSQLTLERQPIGTSPPDDSPLGLVTAAAAVRGAAVAVSGALLAAAISLVLWALTPAGGSDATVAVKAGVAGFAAANLMPVAIAGVALTIPPLLFTALIAALLMGTARRGRFLPVGRNQETAAVLVTAASYGLAVAVITRGFAPAGVVPAAWVWTATVLAFVTTAGATLARGSGWREWWRCRAAGWLQAGIRATGVGLAVMIAGGGVALTVAMVTHFGSIVSVGALAAPSWTDGLGMALLGAAYVPNAVVAAVGYVSGVGFEIGPGTYSPFASSTVDLPALPLLAAAPDHVGRSLVGMAFLAVPLIAGFLLARVVARTVRSRSERAMAAAAAAALTGLLVGCLSWIARGGVGTALWSTMGSAPLLVGAVVAVELGAVAVATAVLSDARTVPWRPAEAVVPEPVSTESASTESASTESASTESVSTESVSTESVSSESASTEAVESEAVDSGTGETDEADTELPDPELADPEGTDPADTDAVENDAAPTDPEDRDPEVTGPPDVDPEDTGPPDVDPADSDAPVTDFAEPEDAHTDAESPSIVDARSDENAGPDADSEIEYDSGATAGRTFTLPEQRIHDDGPDNSGRLAAAPEGGAADTATDDSGPNEAHSSDDDPAGQRNDHQPAGRQQ